jgi:hypothetical protein
VTMSDIMAYFSDEDAAFTAPAWDLLRDYGDLVSALLYATIFFPDFDEVDGSILLRDNIHDRDVRFRKAKSEGRHSLAALEASFNSVEIGYLCPRPLLKWDTIQEKLVKIMSETWKTRLKQLYPSRIFSISIMTPAESGDVYSVQFFEVR